MRAISNELTAIALTLALAPAFAACDRGEPRDEVELVEDGKTRAIPDEPTPAKTEYVQFAKQRLRALDAEIGRLEQQASEETSQQAHELIARLHDARDEARAQVFELQGETGDAWEAMRARTHEALLEAELRLREIAPRLEALSRR